MSIFSQFFSKKEDGPTKVPTTAAPPAEFNFKQRVEAFWVWYSSVAERFYQTIEDKQCGSLSDEVSDKVEELLPGMAWVFGPGPERQGHSFTLSGEGIQPKQMLAAYWLSRAPAIPGWTFYASRQPDLSPGGFTLGMGEINFKPIEFWVTPEIDEEGECVHLSIWHPLADQVEMRTCQTALYLILDEIFGEFGTDRWIGRPDFSKAKLAESMPISELKEFVDTAAAARGWKMRTPCDSWVSYRITAEGAKPDVPRGDVFAGSTRFNTGTRDFSRDPANYKDPFAALSAHWIYLSLDVSSLPAGREVDARGEMEDVIIEALEAAHSGTTLGGASGSRSAYIDFLIYDGSHSIAIIREAAQRAGMPEGTRIEFAGAEQRKSGGFLFDR